MMMKAMMVLMIMMRIILAGLLRPLAGGEARESTRSVLLEWTLLVYYCTTAVVQ